MVKLSPGVKMVSSAIVWETHLAWFSVPALGVSLDGVPVGLAVTPGVGVGGFVAVALGSGSGVTDGVRARSRTTCTITVAAISVRRGSRSIVGELVGGVGLQADNHRRLRNNPIRSSVLFLWATRLILR
jgi:hypothetical protein